MPNKHRTVLKSCVICGKEFPARLSNVKKGFGHTCSPEHAGLLRVKKKRTALAPELPPVSGADLPDPTSK